MNGALIMPTAKVGIQIAWRSRSRKISGVMPPYSQQTRPAP
jgi:hypothetical protein